MSRFHRRAPALSLACALTILLLSISLAPAKAKAVSASDSVAGTRVSAKQTAAATPSADEYVGEETCLTCHEDRKSGYQGSAHARAFDPRSPAVVACLLAFVRGGSSSYWDHPRLLDREVRSSHAHSRKIA